MTDSLVAMQLRIRKPAAHDGSVRGDAPSSLLNCAAILATPPRSRVVARGSAVVFVDGSNSAPRGIAATGRSPHRPITRGCTRERRAVVFVDGSDSVPNRSCAGQSPHCPDHRAVVFADASDSVSDRGCDEQVSAPLVVAGGTSARLGLRAKLRRAAWRLLIDATRSRASASAMIHVVGRFAIRCWQLGDLRRSQPRSDARARRPRRPSQR